MPLPKQVLQPELNPLTIARILWKNGLWALLIAVVVGGAVAAYVRTLPAIYYAEALILVDTQKIPERYVSSTVNTRVQDRLATITSQILSVTELRKVIDQFNLYLQERQTLAEEEVIERMRSDITVEIERGWSGSQPGAFRVGYQGKDPQLVAEVAGRLAQLFIEQNLRTREAQAAGTADFIDSQLEEAKKTLDELEAQVSQYKLAHRGGLPEQENSLLGTLGRLELELQGNQDALNRAQQNKVILQSSIDTAENALSAQRRLLEQVSKAGMTSPYLRATRASQVQQRLRSEELQEQYNTELGRKQPAHPDMLALAKAIEIQKQLEAKRVSPVTSPAPNSAEPAQTTGPAKDPAVELQLMEATERIQGLRTQLELAEREITQRTADRERILQELEQYEVRVEQIPVREQEMSGLTRDYEMAKTHYESLLDKRLSAGMATDMERRQQAERFELQDPPTVPEIPISPDRPMLTGAGGVLGLALGLAFIIGKDVKRNAILGEWELPSGIPVLGRVPAMDLKPTVDRKATWIVASAIGALFVAVCATGILLYMRGA